MADKSKLGTEFPSCTFTVEKDKIIEFAVAVAQKENKEQINPIYYDENEARKAGYDGIPAPPTFSVCSFFWTGGGLMGTIKKLGIDLSRLRHREEEYEYFGCIYAGDIITRKMRVTDMIKKGKKERPIEITILETEYINQHGKLVLKSRTKLMEI
ncbi:MAG: MaoC family dehydratase N-terminal domain-containing protein [Deltaproteobacteria bacterium]|nr:MaoC family dehydratase N-terminal domain-containing protein [Deltaproteobacteria bacterium]